MFDNNKIDKLCFCCLSEEGQLKDMLDELFASTTSTKVQLIAGYTICSGIPLDGEPTKKICQTCEQKLKASYDFRELCQASYRTLTAKADEVIPDVKHEVQSDSDVQIESVYDTTTVKTEAVFIKNERLEFISSSSSKKDSKTGQQKKKKATVPPQLKKKRTPPSDVETSDLESDFLCFHCDIVLPTHRAYLKHYEQHRVRKAYKRIHRTCHICQEETKTFTKHIIEQHKDYKPFKCRYCDKNYQRPGQLRGHLSYHAANKNVECRTCHEKFKRMQGLRLHIFNHDNPKDLYFCPFCGLTFAQFECLSEHFQLKHNTTKTLFPCFHCKRIFKFRKMLDRHKCSLRKKKNRPEVNQEDVHCDLCAGTFSCQDEFVCHRVLCDENQLPHCKQCNKTFLTKKKLHRHIGTHTPKLKSFICELCGHGSVDMARYEIHKASHVTERNFKCERADCEATFKQIHHLKAHHKSHDAKKQYECHLCKKRFRHHHNIKIHMAIHSDSSELRKFACSWCDHRSPTSAGFTQHMFSHTGEKSVSCTACAEKFPTQSAANSHYRRYHDGIYYQCKFCNSVYRDVKSFKEHLFVHRGFFPFNCPLCPMQYAHKFLFKRHLRNQHKIGYEEKIHGYKETENQDDVVKECRRKNYADLNLPTRNKSGVKKAKIEASVKESVDSFPVLDSQYDSNFLY